MLDLMQPLRGLGTSERFFTVRTEARRTSEGQVRLPVKVRDASLVAAFYAVPFEAAQAQAEARGLGAVRLPGDQGLAVVAWNEVRDCTLGPYGELAVCVLAHQGPPPRLPLVDLLAGRGPVGLLVLELPVTTPMARAASLELWGHPALVADLRYRWEPGVLEATVDAGRPVLTMRLPLGPGLPLPLLDLATLSVVEGAPLKATLRTRAVGYWRSGNATRLLLEHPDHPVARTLAALDLEDPPRAVLHVPRFRYLREAGVPGGQAPGT